MKQQVETKFIIHGATGRMGQEIIALLKPSQYIPFEQVYDLKSYKNVVVIDFSSPQGLTNVIDWCEKHKVPLVTGTTGLEKRHFSQLKKMAKKVPVFWSANMSIGVNLFIRAISALGTKLEDYDLMIQEFHHTKKVDAPSGTAKILKEAVEAALANSKTKKKKNILMHSVRAGGIVGIHKLFLIADDVVFKMEHTALKRAVFAKGAIDVSKWIAGKNKNLYSMADFLND